ncbi:hypothetical protein ABEF95_008659 [Exophiala dermatitidis]
MTSAKYQAMDGSDPSISYVHDIPDDKSELALHKIEQPKYKRPRWRTALRLLLIHGVPVAASCVLIALNAANLRWRSSLASGTGDILSVLQIASKAQELLLLFSLSHVVLFWLMRSLTKGDGIPFGLFVGALGSSLGATPFTSGVWSSLAQSFRKPRLLRLCLLVVGITLLGVVVGPATAIALIPRLDWWPDHTLFKMWAPSSKNFVPLEARMYIPMDIFPTNITKDYLPGDYCSDPSLDQAGFCPYAGFQDLSALSSDERDVNTTLDTAELSLGRRMIRSDGFGGKEYTSASVWTSHRLINNYMSLDYKDGHSAVSSVEASIKDTAPLTPLVDVICGNSTPGTEYNRSLGFMLNFLSNANAAFTNVTPGDGLNWTIDLRDTWNESILQNSSDHLFEWREDVFPNKSVLVGLVLTPGGNDSSPNVTVCAVNAKYIAAKLWYTSTQTVISSDFTWTPSITPGGYLGYGDVGSKYIATQQITISKAWADVLNTNGLLANLIAGSMTDSNHSMYDNSVQNASAKSNLVIPHRQMAALGAAVLDGIARIGVNHSINSGSGSTDATWSNQTVLICNNHGWCSEGPLLGGSEASILNTTHDEFLRQYPGYTADFVPTGYADGRNDTPIMHSFAMPADGYQNWTHISFPVKVYSYSWGFNTTLVKLAVAVLAIYLLIVLVHCCLVLVVEGDDAWVHVRNLGDVLALAWASHPPSPPPNRADSSSSSASLKSESSKTKGVLRSMSQLSNTVAPSSGQASRTVGWHRSVALKPRWASTTDQERDGDADSCYTRDADMVFVAK